jgi:alanine racemase
VIKSLNRVEISLSALRHNLCLLKERAAGSTVLAMVKADGYGHGMVDCARALATAGADRFGVAEAVEGIELRNNGIRQPVLIMAGILPEIIPDLLSHDLTPVIVDGSCLAALSAEAVQQGIEVGLHLKIDAGMGRQGCALTAVKGIVREIVSLPGIELAGMLAHFPMADDPDSDSTPAITAAFEKVVQGVVELLPDNKKITLHLANSGGILYFPLSWQNLIRPGIALYGCYPDGAAGRQRAERAGETMLQPVMRFSSRIIQVKELPTGAGLGYGHTFVCKRPTRIAIIPAGYEDGYLRCLSNRAEALIHGQRVPVVGRVSMNLTMFDVTELDRVEAGDEVVLLGQQGDDEITADEVASWMDTINYEVLCLFGNLNQRVYL